MKYGTPTRLKYLVPYRKGLYLCQDISSTAKKRLKWMDYIDKGNSILKASRHFDIPEATIRYWRLRYNPYDLKSLEDRSRRPKRCRRSEVPYEVIERVIELRQEYKGWGKVKIQILLKREGIYVGQSRIQKIINQAGLKRVPYAKKRYKRKNRRHMYAVPRKVLKEPGGLVYLDVKHLNIVGYGKLYQFTAIDHATKILKAKVYGRITSLSGLEFVKYIRKEFPFKEIKYIGTDNGSEFLGSMDKYLKEEGIIHVFSSPRSPKQNPFVERVIRTIIDDHYSCEGTAIDKETQQKALDRYVKIYNEVRPHHSLNLMTPYEKYDTLINAP